MFIIGRGRGGDQVLNKLPPDAWSWSISTFLTGDRIVRLVCWTMDIVMIISSSCASSWGFFLTRRAFYHFSTCERLGRGHQSCSWSKTITEDPKPGPNIGIYLYSNQESCAVKNGVLLGWEIFSAEDFNGLSTMLWHYPLAVGLVVPGWKI